jgi:hypothetical protein
MILLPNDLDVDPGYSALMTSQSAKNRSAERVRLWAKFFAPISNSNCIEVALGWENCFIASLLNTSSFDWAKLFLSSEAWDVILNDSRGDTSISFSIPNKCPTKRKLECTISEIDEDGEDDIRANIR